MKVAIEHVFTGSTSTGSYDPTKTMIGTQFRQYTGVNPGDKYVSIVPPLLSNNVEITLQSLWMPHVYQWSDNIWWVFSASNATAAATRNISLHEYNVSAHTLTWKGMVTLSGTTIPGAKLIRGFRSFVTKHTTGTVSTSGTSTSILGNSTTFQTERIAVGARIGFETTDPTLVSTWYDITAIASDTGLTINMPVTLAGGTSYVIEEIRLAIGVTNASLYLGGVHLIKGLNYGIFTSGGTVIPEATTVDNIRASYLLRDKVAQTCTISIATPGVVTCNDHGFVAGDLVSFSTTGTLPTGATANTTFYVIATGLTAGAFQFSATLNGAAVNTTVSQAGTHTLWSGLLNIGMGVCNDDFVSNTQQDLYFLNNDNATTTRIHKFNLRASLTTVAGISVSAWSLKTLGVATVGTVQQVGNGRIFAVNHGAASGIKSLYFVTATRVYRCKVADITEAGGSWLSDYMLENPPGTLTTNLAAPFLQVDYSSALDRILISTTLAGRNGIYVTTYDTSNPQFEKMFGQITNRTKILATDANAPDAFFNPSSMTMWTEGGILFAMPTIATTGLNWLGILYIKADGLYAGTTGERVITPKLATTGASELYRVYASTNQHVGGYALGYMPEPIRIYYRITGIDDDTGAWTEVVNGDLSTAVPGDFIQFMVYFDILGEFCIPRKLYSIACVYEDGSTELQDSHYLASADLSDKTTKTFAWKHAVLFSSAVPRLRIRLYNAITNGILDDDDSVTQTGSWQKSTDGGSTWGAYDTVDKTNELTFIKFTPASIPDNIQVRALLTLYQ